VFGILLIAANIGLIPRDFNRIIISWQMLLIVIGIIVIVKRRTLHFPAVICTCLGIFFIIPEIVDMFPSIFGGVISGKDFTRNYWPVLLIVGGIVILLHILCKPPVSCYNRHRHRGYSHFHSRVNENHRHFRDEENRDCEYDFTKTSVFGSGQYVVVDTEFTGGTLNSVCGSIELDLRKAYLPEGETVLIVEAVMGSISVFVPYNWLLDIKVDSVLGGIEDERRIMEPTDTSRKLIIKGSVVMGAVEIKN
jgi:predicted membrane protein